MFQTKVVEQIKIHILYSITFSRKSCRLLDNVEKYGGSSGGTRVACWISTATRKHAHAHARAQSRTRIHADKYVIITALPRRHYFKKEIHKFIMRSYHWLIVSYRHHVHSLSNLSCDRSTAPSKACSSHSAI